MSIWNHLLRINNKTLAKAAVFIHRHWADICLWTGIASGAGAVVATGVQTTKLEPIVAEHEEQLRVIATKAANDKGYSEKDQRTDRLKVYARTLGKLGKLYAVPAGLEAVSIATRVSGHRTLKGENLALAAAYTGVYEAYKKLKAQTPKEETIVIPFEENGDEKSDATKLQEALLEHPYCRVFHSQNKYWHGIFEENVAFLRSKMALANERFHARGFLYLNEVFDMIGIPLCDEGEYIGWVEGSGDDFVDFGITPIVDSRVDGGISPSIWLDFNVDGHVEELMGWAMRAPNC